MATIHKEFTVHAPVDRVWAAFLDIGAVHTRLARRFVVDTRLEGGSRVVTFANGAVVRERIVTVDEARRRLAYAVTEWQTTHHNASFQVFDDGNGHSRVVWITDLLPNELGAVVGELVEHGAAAIKRTLESDSSDRACTG
jgi:activator of HSP90 ATPase